MCMTSSCGGRRTPLTTKVRTQFLTLLFSRDSSMGVVPFLPVRDDFHPKRNQARQKLATLPTGRFKDLSSDVHFELGRRYPEFKEEVSTTLCISYNLHLTCTVAA